MNKVRNASAIALLVAAVIAGACKTSTTSAVREIQTQRADNLVIALLNDQGELARGQNRFLIEFRSADDNKPVDVGTVTIGSSMGMPGMAPMTAPIELEPGSSKGQYSAKGEFAMSGSWKFEVRWDGPAGRGAASFNSSVR